MDIELKLPGVSINTAPPEIVLQIAKSVPELRSLHHMALTLPSIYRLWKYLMDRRYSAQLRQIELPLRPKFAT